MEEKINNILTKMKGISYGWVDKYGMVHHHSKRTFFLDNYKFMSIDETLAKGVGTCFEQTALVKYYLDQEGIENHTYIIIYNDPDKIARHTVCIAQAEGKYYLMDSSWLVNDKQTIYSNLEDILIDIIRHYPKIYKIDEFDKNLIEVYEYHNPIPGMNYYEFSENSKKGKIININL